MSTPTATRLTILTSTANADIQLRDVDADIKAASTTRNVVIPEGTLPVDTSTVQDCPIVASNDDDGVIYSGEIIDTRSQYHAQGHRTILRCVPTQLGPSHRRGP